MLPLIPLISLAAGLVPDIIGLFGGKRAGEVAGEVANVVKQVAGTQDIQAATQAISENPRLADELKVKLAQIKQRYTELQIQDAQNERLALIETLKAEISDRSRASDTMLAALEANTLAAKTVALGPIMVSAVVVVGFFVFTGFMVLRPASSTTSLTSLTLLNVVVGALVAGFTAVINFWLGSSQSSRDKDKAVQALQVAQTQQATETVRQVRQATTEGITAGAASKPTIPIPVVVPPAQPIVVAPPVQPGAPSHFDLCLPIILEREGGFSDHPMDRGGPTMMGITQATLADWRDNPVTADDVRNLQMAEVGDIYRTKYWNVMCCDEMPKGLDLALFDYGVNSGPKRAIKTLQGIIGTEPDGAVGPFTMRATKATDTRALIETLSRLRVEFLQTLSTFPTFGDGWLKRVEEVRKRALLMAV